MFLETYWCLFMWVWDFSLIFRVPFFLANWSFKWIAWGLWIFWVFSVIRGKEGKWNTTCKWVHYLGFTCLAVSNRFRKELFIIQSKSFSEDCLERQSLTILIQRPYFCYFLLRFPSYWDFTIIFLHLGFLLLTKRSVSLIIFHSWYFRCFIDVPGHFCHLVQLLFVPSKVFFWLPQRY